MEFRKNRGFPLDCNPRAMGRRRSILVVASFLGKASGHPADRPQPRDCAPLLGSPIRKITRFPLKDARAMVLSANISAMSDAAGGPFIVENPPMPVGRRAWAISPTLKQQAE